MTLPQRKYPVGIQTFERIIKEGFIYVDKTDLVWQLANSSTFAFLSRPRRFGKSLLTTTLASYFRGQRELFEGLKIMDLEKEWKEYPVIHLDLSTAKNQKTPDDLVYTLMFRMRKICEEYNIDTSLYTPGKCLETIITKAYEQTGSQVVVLIDEYDAPLLDVMHEDDCMPGMKRVMQEFYQPLKACEAMIRFCFITGITKFSQFSIFSTLNNIKNVSMAPRFSTICGITEEELTTALSEDIEMMAEVHGCTPEEIHTMLKRQYDGYHFSAHSQDVYNPYSLFNCFDDMDIQDYWFESGTPTFLLHQIKRFNMDITNMDDIEAPATAFNIPTEALDNALPLLYQSGYLTIKGYDDGVYTLGIPNQEVRIGITKGLLPIYSGVDEGRVHAGCALKMWRAIRNGDIDLTLRELKTFLARVPYVEGFKTKLAEVSAREGFYEYTFYLILSMLNVYVQTQVKCYNGRVDMVVNAPDAVYIFEFKVKSTAERALHQITERHYADRFSTESRRVVSVGVNFDIDTWTIEDWAIKEG